MEETPILEHLGDIPLELRAQLDRKMLKVRDILDLRPGTVLPTAKPIEQGIDVYVGAVRIGSGEVIAMGKRTELRLMALAPVPRR